MGRINKTLYLLNYIDDEDYRRRILTQLNRGESRHAVARAICHGQKGEIRKRYTDGQEDQLGALGLVTNAVVSRKMIQHAGSPGLSPGAG
ncbi:Tn3 family transposase [Escherichia coli]